MDHLLGDTCLLLAAEAPGSVVGPRWAGLILLLPLLAMVLCGVCAALRIRSKLPANAGINAVIERFGLARPVSSFASAEVLPEPTGLESDAAPA